MTVERHLVTLFDPETQRITNHCDLGDSTYENYVETKVPFIDGIFDKENYYVSDGVPMLRQGLTTTLSGTTLSSLPVGGTLYLNGAPYPITDSVCELTLPVGHYTIKVEKFPYLDRTFEVSV